LLPVTQIYSQVLRKAIELTELQISESDNLDIELTVHNNEITVGVQLAELSSKHSDTYL
jgi:hypothetical protein